MIDGMSALGNPDATIPYTHLSIIAVASMGSRHYPIIANLPDGTPIKLNPEWVVANKYCALENGRFAGKTLMGMQFVFNGPAEWLTAGTIVRGNPAADPAIEWNVVQDLANCIDNQGEMNRLHFMETDLSRFPPAKSHTADTYYIGMQESIITMVEGLDGGSRRQMPVFGDFYYDNGKYVITSINSWNASKDSVWEVPAPTYCSENTSAHEIVYACYKYS